MVQIYIYWYEAMPIMFGYVKKAGNRNVYMVCYYFWKKNVCEKYLQKNIQETPEKESGG